MSSQRNTGFILLHRTIREHWIWQDSVKLKWWMDILMECNHSDQKVTLGYEILECKRGQSLNSLLTWSKMWRVDVGQVRRYFRLLEDDGMIVTENVVKTTRLTVCNYDSYNSIRHANDTQTTRKRIPNDTQVNTNNNDNNVNNDNNDKYKEEERGAFAPHEREEFKKFEQWLAKSAPQVLKMREPFTIKQFFSIKDLAPPETIRDVLKAMHNRADLLKKYRSANLTLRNWLKREKTTTANTTHQPAARTTNKNAGALALLNKGKSDFQIIKGRAENTGS